MNNFSLKIIRWKETLQVNLIRSVLAGIVWGIIILIMANTDPNVKEIPQVAFLMPIFVPFGYFLCYLPLGIVCGWLSKIGVPFIGLVSFLPAIFIYPADPFMFFLHKVKPEWVPVERYRFIEPVLSIWVIDRHIHDFARKVVSDFVE